MNNSKDKQKKIQPSDEFVKDFSEIFKLAPHQIKMLSPQGQYKYLTKTGSE